MTKRLFVGVFVDKSIFENKLDLIKQEFDKVTIGKWVEDYNLHFTLKFIGDFQITEISKLKSALSEHLLEYNEILEFSGLSVLPNKTTPRVLYVNISTETNLLLEKAIIIDDICSDFDISREQRAFTPHLTLLRMKSVNNNFYRILDKYKNFNFGTLERFKIELIESRLTPAGPQYKIL